MATRSGGKALRTGFNDKLALKRAVKLQKGKRRKTKVNFGRRLTVISENNLDVLLQYLEVLSDMQIELYASGEYPETKRRTPVQDVAFYQNDGTKTIKPARFVDKAIRKARGWQSPIFRGVADIFNNGSTHMMEQALIKASFDISAATNRIKTGRLKRSFSYRYLIKR